MHISSPTFTTTTPQWSLNREDCLSECIQSIPLFPLAVPSFQFSFPFPVYISPLLPIGPFICFPSVPQLALCLLANLDAPQPVMLISLVQIYSRAAAPS